jgi:hypothetical protein
MPTNCPDDHVLGGETRASRWRLRSWSARWAALSGRDEAPELLAAVADDRCPVGEQEMVEVNLGGEPREAVPKALLQRLGVVAEQEVREGHEAVVVDDAVRDRDRAVAGISSALSSGQVAEIACGRMPELSSSPRSYGCTRSAGSSCIPVRGARIVAPRRSRSSNAERVWWRCETGSRRSSCPRTSPGPPPRGAGQRPFESRPATGSGGSFFFCPLSRVVRR